MLSSRLPKVTFKVTLSLLRLLLQMTIMACPVEFFKFLLHREDVAAADDVHCCSVQYRVSEVYHHSGEEEDSKLVRTYC